MLLLGFKFSLEIESLWSAASAARGEWTRQENVLRKKFEFHVFSLPSILHLVSIPTPDDFLPSVPFHPSQSRHIVFWQVIPWMDFLLLLYRRAQWILMSQKNFFLLRFLYLIIFSLEKVFLIRLFNAWSYEKWRWLNFHPISCVVERKYF